MTKYERYQDYAIRDGKVIGEFEEMYRDFPEPWDQCSREAQLSYKEMMALICQKYGFQRILEFGCGLGFFTQTLKDHNPNVTGVDISETAIKKARGSYPDCQFIVGDILDFDIYKRVNPDCIIIAEMTWFILDKLEEFLRFYRDFSNGRKEGPVYLLHLLNTYPPGVQQYGREYFADIGGILEYFRLEYEEYGAITYKSLDYCTRTYFLGKPK